MSKHSIMAAILLHLVAVVPAWASGIEGIWRTEEGRSHITITRCGTGYCGYISYLAEPNDASGQAKRDVNNENPVYRDRLLLGLTIITDLQPLESQGFWKGKIYNPEDGDVYSATISPHPDGLKVEGCVAYVLCGSQIWTRVERP